MRGIGCAQSTTGSVLTRSIILIFEFHRVDSRLAARSQNDTAADFLARIEIEFVSVVEPELAAGFRVKMPVDYIAHMGIEILLCPDDFLF